MNPALALNLILTAVDIVLIALLVAIFRSIGALFDKHRSNLLRVVGERDGRDLSSGHSVHLFRTKLRL